MRSLRWPLSNMTSILIRKEDGHTNTQAHGEKHHGTTEAEIKMLKLQAKEH